MDEFLRTILDLLNETLVAAIVVIAVSMLLYNITRNIHDRIARSSGIVLGCVTIAYIGDVLIALGPGITTFEALLRLQWIGLAFIPSAMFHLSDALLATTGLPSRGRRRRVVRILYSIGAIFLVAAAFTDILINPTQVQDRLSLRAEPFFIVYVAYFIIANSVAFYNVQRARTRCLTRSTQRRMAYLQFAILTPAIGIFPYSVLLGEGQEFSLSALILVNVANLVVILMLLFLSYPLSFFGSRVPDRVVKTELLRFILRGPATGLLALFVIVFTNPTTEVLELPGETFMPFATVSVILLWQWAIDVGLPKLERLLIYNQEDDQTTKLQRLSERYLSRHDLTQLIEAILEASCDYLRVNQAFILSLAEKKPEMIQSVGKVDLPNLQDDGELNQITDLFSPSNDETIQFHHWSDFWILPLYSNRINDVQNDNQQLLIGIMGIEARSEEITLDTDEIEVLNVWIRRASRTLDDLMLQTEIYAALEGLLPQILITRQNTAEVEYRPGRTSSHNKQNDLLNRDQFIEQVQAALRHYWGGPGLTRSRLLELNVVKMLQTERDITPIQALREVLQNGIEKLRPEGERSMKNPEWTLYNIITLRFLEKRKARETAKRLYISEANLYRKQNVAITEVSDAIISLEQESKSPQH